MVKCVKDVGYSQLTVSKVRCKYEKDGIVKKGQNINRLQSVRKKSKQYALEI